MVISGPREAESWTGGRDAVDFFDLKGDLESLVALGGDSLVFEPAQRTGLHPGQTAAINRGGKVIGYMGALHPAVAAKLDVPGSVYVCELALEPVLEAAIPAFHELSRYPEVRRDLAVIVDKTVPAQELLGNVRSVAGTYLTDLTLFDVYEGKGIDPKRKSLALGLTFRDQSRTLSDEDVNQAVQQVIDSLEKNYNAELRG
jgi:phenylalanyl-tRNA synthetase beta chain